VEEIEQRAERALGSVPAYVWDGDSLPVPVEDIVESHYGLLVRDVDDMTAAPDCPELEPGQALSGLLLASRGEIWVNADEARQWPPRRRFTIGHELGHWVMHRAGRRSVFCRSATVQPDEQEAAGAGVAPPPDIEQEASAFAAALLMPAFLLRREYERDRTFERLCERFGASGAAMGRRLHAVI
jgi:hypothetical protein